MVKLCLRSAIGTEADISDFSISKVIFRPAHYRKDLKMHEKSIPGRPHIVYGEEQGVENYY
jgi:hypothetical protein